MWQLGFDDVWILQGICGVLESLMWLKDMNPLFDEVKAKGGIGMPCV